MSYTLSGIRASNAPRPDWRCGLAPSVSATPASPPADTPGSRGAFRSALLPVGLSVLAAGGLYAVSQYSYILFHGAIEMFAAAVALTIFTVTWNSRRFMDNHYVGVIGVAYLGVGIVGLMHALAYKGMNVFPGATSNLPTQLWLVDRYLAALAFLVAPLFIRRRLDFRVALWWTLGVTAVALGAVFAGLFPTAFAEGVGLTPFKVASEYTVILVLAVALFLLLRTRDHFDRRVWRLLASSIVLTAAAEVAFTLYADPFGPFNLIGHLVYVAAAVLVYLALVKTALEDPYSVLFRRLKQREEELEQARILSDGLTHIVTGAMATLDVETVMQETVRLASEVMSADAVAVSLSTGDGWTVRWTHGHPDTLVGRALRADEIAHAAEAVRTRDVVAISDARSNALTRTGILESLGVQAVLTVPFAVASEPLALLSFHFREPHVFSDREVDFARRLATAVALVVDNARLFAAEHEVSETLQAGLRPALDTVAGVETGFEYRSSPGVGTLGGDFFDLFLIDDTHVAIMIGDVSGKGIRAATTTATVRGAVRALAYAGLAPVPVLNALNTTLEHRGLDAGFVTLLYTVLDVESGKMEICIAGHPTPYLCGRERQPDFEAIVDPPLGLFLDRPYHSGEARLERGEVLVMYTDGLIDARAEGLPFGEEGVCAVLSGCAGAPVQEIATSLADAAERHAGGVVPDDVAVLALRFLGR